MHTYFVEDKFGPGPFNLGLGFTNLTLAFIYGAISIVQVLLMRMHFLLKKTSAREASTQQGALLDGLAKRRIKILRAT